MKQRRRVTLDLDVGSDPITGVLRDEHAASTPFCGWLALASALEQLLRPVSADAASTQTEPAVRKQAPQEPPARPTTAHRPRHCT